MKTRNVIAALICVCALLVSAFAQAQPNSKLKPNQTLLLYPEGQEVDKGLEGAQGPCVSNGCTKPEEINPKGNIGYITEPTIDLYFPKKPNGQMVVVCPGGGYKIVSS